MGSRIIYNCDLCEKEVEHRPQQITVTCGPSKMEFDICDECTEKSEAFRTSRYRGSGHGHFLGILRMILGFKKKE